MSVETNLIFRRQLGFVGFDCGKKSPQREAGDQQIICQRGGAIHQTSKLVLINDLYSCIPAISCIIL